MDSGTPALTELLIRLTSSDPCVRNGAALDLRDLAETGTRVPVGPLFSAILDPANHNNRGTLVYALQTMDCSDRFDQLFDLALHGNFECQNHALTILEEQKMEMTSELLQEANEKLRTFRPTSNVDSEGVEMLRAELLNILSRLGDGIGPDCPTNR